MKNNIFKIIRILVLILMLIPFINSIDLTDTQGRSIITGDTFTDPTNPLTNYGTDSNLYISSSSTGGRRAFLNFNLTQAGIEIDTSIINNAIFSIYLHTQNNPSTSYTIGYYYCNDTFDESTLNRNNEATEVINCEGSPFATETQTTATGWKSVNITSLLQSYQKNQFTIKMTLTPEGSGTTRQNQYYSKEYGTITLRPRLNINYDIVEPTITVEPYYNVSDISWNLTTVLSSYINYSLGYSLSSLFGYSNQISQDSTNITIRNDTLQLSKTYDDGLVAYYDFNDGTATDYSGNGNDGTAYNGVVFNSTAYEGLAANFDGVDDYVGGINNIDDTFTDKMSVCLWIYPEETQVSFNGVFGNKPDAGYWGIDSSGNRFGINGKYVQSVINKNTWTFLCVIYNSSIIELYYNNILVDSELYSGTIPNSHNIFIGYRGDLNRYFNGSIDDVRIYNRALSSTEISELYNNQNSFQDYGEITKQINITDYENKSYCQVTADNVSLNNGLIKYFNDGTEINYGQVFAHNPLSNYINITTQLFKLNSTISPEVTNLKITCGQDSDNLGYYNLCTNCSNGTISYTDLTEGGHELNLFLTDITGSYNYSYPFIVDLTQPTLTQLSTYQEGYKFYFYDTFDINELNFDTCTYTTDGKTKDCSQTIYYNENGDYNINVTILDLAGNSNTYTNLPLTINASYSFVELNSYKLNITDFCYNTSTCTFLDLNVSFNSSNTTYTMPYNGETYWLRTYNNETVAENVTLYVNPYIYISFYNNDAELIQNFTLNGVEYVNNASYLVYDLGLGDYSYLFSKNGYEDTLIDFTLTRTVDVYMNYSINYSMIQINIYDRTTGLYITYNMTVVLVSTVGYKNYTSTGKLNISGVQLYNESYQIIVSGTNYISESVYFNFDNREVYVTNIYMIKSNLTNYGTHTIKVITDTGLLVNTAICQALEWNPLLSAFVSVAQGLTDTSGQVLLNIELGTKLYKFQCTKGTSSATSSNNIISISGLSTTLQLETTIITPNNIFESLTYSLTNTTINSTHQRITYTWNDGNGLVDTGCLKIYKVVGTKLTVLQQSCIPSSSTNIQLIQDIDEDYKIRAVSTIEIDGLVTELNTIDFNNTNLEYVLADYGLDIILPLIFILLGISIGFLTQPQNIYMSIIGSIIGVWISVAIVPTLISTIIASFVTLICILMLWGGYKYK